MIFREAWSCFHKKPKKGKRELEMLENSEENQIKPQKWPPTAKWVSFLEKNNMDSGSLELVIRNALGNGDLLRRS